MTYNNMVEMFRRFTDNHYFLKTFVHGEQPEMTNEKLEEYPLLFLLYTGSQYADGTETLGFEVYILDLPLNKETRLENQTEVVSDCKQVAEDILADIELGGNIFVFPDFVNVVNASILPAIDTTTNLLSGVILTLGIDIPWTKDSCFAPLIGAAPTPLPPCEDGEYYNGGAGADEVRIAVPSGTTVTAGAITITDVDGSTRTSVPNIGVACEFKPFTISSSDGVVLILGISTYPAGGNRNEITIRYLQPNDSTFATLPYRQVQLLNAVIASVVNDAPNNLRANISVALIDILNSDGEVLLSPADLIGDKTLPDTPVTDDDGAVGSYPVPTSIVIDGEVTSASYAAGVLTIQPAGGAPSGLIYMRPGYRGQTVSYADYDLGFQAAAGTYNYGNPSGQSQSLDWAHAAPFYRLNLNNAFGNKFIFTDSEGVEAPDGLADFSGVDWAVDRPTAIPYYVICHLTGLAFIIVKVAFTQQWGDGAAECLGFAEGYTHGGFSDYRIPSSGEIEDVINTGAFSTFFGTNNIFFRSNALSSLSGNETSVWLNGTNPANPAQALILNDSGDITRAGKTTTTLRGTYIVRTHYA